MTTMIICFLIVYGISYIITESVLFSGFRNRFESAFKARANILLDKCAEDILNDEYRKYPGMENLFSRFMETTDENLSEKLRNEYILKIFEIKKASDYRYIMLEKLYQLVNCPICISFWVGLFVSFITHIYDLSLFGQKLSIIDGTNIIPLFFFSIICVAGTKIIKLFDKE